MRSHGPLLVAVALLVLHFASFDFESLPLVTDARYYAYFSWRIAEGDVPHLDFFDNKTQLTSYAGAVFYKVSNALGVDALIGMRIGYLLLSVLGGLLAFLAYRQLAGGVAALLGVLAYCTFGLMGILPAIGPTPKLWMSVAATAAALLVRRGLWFWAGFAGAVGFMDWQIGVLVWIAAFISACVLERTWRAALLVAAGGAAGLAPFVLYYAWNGALVDTFSQVVLASLYRGAAVAKVSSLASRLDTFSVVSGFALGSRAFLFYWSALGMAVAGWWLWRRPEHRRLLLPLAIYHFGVVAFSLTDFQWYGDYFLLLHTASFFLALLYIAVCELAVARMGARVHARSLVTVMALVVAAVLARPGPLQPDMQLRRVKPAPYRGASLQDQLEVAAILSERIGVKRVAFLEHSDLLFLMRRANGFPTVFWNRPTWSVFRSSPEEDIVSSARRMVLEADAEVVVVPPTRIRWLKDARKGEMVQILVDYAPVLEDFQTEYILSRNGKFRVVYGIRLDGSEARPDGIVTLKERPAGMTVDLDPQRVEQLRALGYAQVGAPLADDVEVGVRIFDRERARPGINLFTDAKACATHLMDMEGEIFHSWSLEPCFRWDNSVLLPDGDLLVTTRERKGANAEKADAARFLIRLAWNGELRWKRPLRVHHDVELTPDDDILAMTHQFRMIPEVDAETPVRDHTITRLSHDGDVIDEVSLWDILSASPEILRLEAVKRRRFEGHLEVDLFHSNSVEQMRYPELEGRHPIYARDNVLASIRNQDSFVIFDWKKRKLIWAWGRGEVSNPHDATLLPNGNVLAFDNGLGRGWSRVIELDPIRREIVWEYRAPEPTSFYTRSRGANQRLSGGNTLITESDSGRVFEVTADGDVVWEFVNPNLTEDREPGVIVRMRRFEAVEFSDLEARVEHGEPLPRVD